MWQVQVNSEFMMEINVEYSLYGGNNWPRNKYSCFKMLQNTPVAEFTGVKWDEFLHHYWSWRSTIAKLVDSALL